jgi:hypothetical protein
LVQITGHMCGIYLDAQNTYVSSPGFTELESNDMVKTFDRNRALPVTEKTLAAVSPCAYYAKREVETWL